MGRSFPFVSLLGITLASTASSRPTRNEASLPSILEIAGWHQQGSSFSAGIAWDIAKPSLVRAPRVDALPLTSGKSAKDSLQIPRNWRLSSRLNLFAPGTRQWGNIPRIKGKECEATPSIWSMTRRVKLSSEREVIWESEILGSEIIGGHGGGLVIDSGGVVGGIAPNGLLHE